VIGFYAVPTGFTAVFTARFLGLPSVLCLRGNDIDRAVYHGGQADQLGWALRHSDAVVGVSRELVRKASLLSGRSDPHFIPNSVDSDLFVYRPASEIISRHLVFCGEMRLKKGSEVLLQALSELSGDWSLTLAGGFRGAAESAYRQWSVRDRQAARRVRLLPYARDAAMLNELYGQADLVLNPALWDGMPNSVLEAMACGRPTLSTRVGGLPDLVQDGETGYLLGLSDLGGLAPAIEQILRDPNRHRIGEAARAHVQAHHQPAQEARAYQELLQAVVAGRPPEAASSASSASTW
jgi:glycosyltransferase involved in cell wall biosynthesis